MKKYLILALLLIAPLSAHASMQLVCGRGSVSTPTTTQFYANINTFGGAAGADTNRASTTVPIAGTFSNLFINLSSAPGGTATYSFMLRKNAANTAITCTVGSTATTCVNSTTAISVAAGDAFSLRISSANTPPAVDLSWCLNFTPTTSGDTWVSGSQGVTVGLETFSSLNNQISGGSASETTRSSVWPDGGTIDSIIAKLSVAPSVGSNVEYFLRNNLASTTLTCNIADTAQTCSASSAVSVTAGQYGAIGTFPTGTPANTALNNNNVNFKYTPSTPNTFGFFANHATVSGSSSTGYMPMNGNITTVIATEASSSQAIGAPVIVRSIYVRVSADPGGAGRTRVYTLMQNGVATPITCTVPNGSTTCSLTGQRYQLNTGDLIDTLEVNSASVANATAAVSYLLDATRRGQVIVNKRLIIRKQLLVN